MCHLLPGIPETMTDWLKKIQVGNRCKCHFYVILSMSYIASYKKLSDTTDERYTDNPPAAGF